MRQWLCVLLIVLMIVPGCSSSKPPNFVGTLRAAGKNVTVNGRPVEKEADVYNGDDVATGPASSALLEFDDGGMVQLDENTDPSWLRSGDALGRCSLVMSLKYGQFYAETPAAQKCGWRVELHALEPLGATKFNLDAGSAPTSRLSVLDGRVDVAGPKRVSVGASEQAEVSGARVVETRPLSPAEVTAVVAWRANYTFPSSVSWIQIVTGAVIIIAIAGLIAGIVAATSDDGGSKKQPPSDSTRRPPKGKRPPPEKKPPPPKADPPPQIY